MRLSGKVCLITGATGIAASAASLASREGATVFIASLHEEDCRTLCARITNAGRPAGWVAGDLAAPGCCEAAVANCVDRFGRLDGLFHVAGISGRRFGDGPVHECSDAGWAVTLSANLGTTFQVCRAALRQMLTQQAGNPAFRGAIVTMASVLAFAPQPDFFATHAYAAAKAGIIGLTKAMASYYAPYGIRANAIAPGLVRTPMSARAQSDAELLAYMEKKQPLAGGLMEAEEVAAAAVFLLSEESRMITGDVLTVDAGWTTR